MLLEDANRRTVRRMKLVKILMIVFAVLVATACTSSSGQGKEGGTTLLGASTKELVVEVSTIT